MTWPTSEVPEAVEMPSALKILTELPERFNVMIFHTLERGVDKIF